MTAAAALRADVALRAVRPSGLARRRTTGTRSLPRRTARSNGGSGWRRLMGHRRRSPWYGFSISRPAMSPASVPAKAAVLRDSLAAAIAQHEAFEAGESEEQDA